MKRTEFERIYASAKTVKIVEDDWFNYAGFFWINLTEGQARKMIDLLKEQNSPEENGWFVFKNGMKIQNTLA